MEYFKLIGRVNEFPLSLYGYEFKMKGSNYFLQVTRISHPLKKEIKYEY